jgi:hypothetical protein
MTVVGWSRPFSVFGQYMAGIMIVVRRKIDFKYVDCSGPQTARGESEKLTVKVR